MAITNGMMLPLHKNFRPAPESRADTARNIYDSSPFLAAPEYAGQFCAQCASARTSLVLFRSEIKLAGLVNVQTAPVNHTAIFSVGRLT